MPSIGDLLFTVLAVAVNSPRTKAKMIGLHGFYFASSAAWNALPAHLHDPELSLNNSKI